MTIRVLTADDHGLVRAGIKAVVTNEADMAIVAEAADGLDAVAMYARHVPDVVLMDLRMPRLDGVGATRAILDGHPKARVVALTSYAGDTDIYRALDAGACGYLIKDMTAADVVGAIRRAATGRRVIPSIVADRLAEFTPRVDLSAREVEVLRLVAKGLRNRDIAVAIGRTEATVKAHLKHITTKPGVDDRTQAVTVAMERGIIRLED